MRANALATATGDPLGDGLIASSVRLDTGAAKLANPAKRSPDYHFDQDPRFLGASPAPHTRL